MNTILIIGACGSGKTWCIKQIIDCYDVKQKCKIGKVYFVKQNNIAVLGVYNGGAFEGSDKLSMSVSTDFFALKNLQNKLNLKIICEGDRFTNKKFITLFSPTIIKIADNGAEGRKKRNSVQSARQIKSIQTRVNNIKEHYTAENSDRALEIVKRLINE